MRMQKICAAGAATVAMFVLTGVANATVFTSQVKMHSGPGADWPVIATIPAGGEGEVLTCAPAWCRVQFGYAAGYVPRIRERLRSRACFGAVRK